VLAVYSHITVAVVNQFKVLPGNVLAVNGTAVMPTIIYRCCNRCHGKGLINTANELAGDTITTVTDTLY
jgi:hypothetical protein